MASRALRQWSTVRRARIDELYAAHAAVGGTSPGRRTATEQLNWSLALRLAAEFQGYARDVHDEGVDVLISRAYAITPPFESVLRNLFTLNRQLTVRNATPSTLQQDFARFGFKVIDEVKARYVHGERWLLELEDLNRARNGIAHGDLAQVAAAASAPTLRLTRVNRWDGAVRSLATALDTIAADKLALLTDGDRPW